MTDREMDDREGHGDQREPKGQRDPEKTYPHVGKRGGENGAAASAENQPKCTDEFGAKLPEERHVDSCHFLSFLWPAHRPMVKPGAKIPESPPEFKPKGRTPA